LAGGPVRLRLIDMGDCFQRGGRGIGVEGRHIRQRMPPRNLGAVPLAQVIQVDDIDRLSSGFTQAHV
jgi:hypothetical protein